MWLQKYDRSLKVGIIGIALVVAIFEVGMEVKAEREFDVLAARQDIDLERNRPFYDCLLASMATVDENSPEADQRAAVAAGDECYERYNREKAVR